MGAGAAAASTVAGAVGPCSVPRHANEKRPVMTVVGGPPILAVRHQGVEIFLEPFVVEGLEPVSYTHLTLPTIE